MTIRRLKTYTGGQGYVYQYYFVGKRPVARRSDGTPEAEYIFDVTSDRKTTYSISVYLSQSVTQAWAAAHGRALTDAEQYGAVKLRLFKGFDELENMLEDGRELRIDLQDLEQAIETLGLE